MFSVVTMSLQASWHQGDGRFAGSGKQCAANAIIAINYSNKVNPSKWDTADMDSILEEGDKLYIALKEEANSDFLTIEDIPQSTAYIDPSRPIIVETLQSEGTLYTLTHWKKEFPYLQQPPMKTVAAFLPWEAQLQHTPVL